MSTDRLHTTRAPRFALCALALAFALVAPRATAQTPAGAPTPPAPSPAAPPAAPAAGTPAAVPPGHPPLPTAPGAMPAGHPPLPNAGNAPGGGMPDVRQAEVPEQGVAEAPELPPGVVLVRVVNAQGGPVEGVVVRLGSFREGERQAARELPTRVDGIAQFTGLTTGANVSYRASVEQDGAKFGSPPFQLPTNVGYHVQLVRFDVEHQPRSVLITDARIEIAFQDDRLVVVERLTLVNFSNMAVGGQAPRPAAFVPTDGLRFRLPAGFSAFRADEEAMGMGDLRVTEDNGHAVVRGTIPPTGARESISVVFQYRVKIESTEVALDVTMPLPVLRSTVVTQAPQGLRLEVDGMQPAEERTHNGQRILLTGRERRSREDPTLGEIHVRLIGIPPSAGPERTLAALMAAFIALGAVGLGVRNRFGGPQGARGDALHNTAALRERRREILEEAAELARAHQAGDVGPETYARRRRELAFALARVLKEIGEAESGPARAAA